MNKNYEYNGYVLNTMNDIMKCLKNTIKDKNILNFINDNVKKIHSSKFYIESNYLYILNKNNSSFSIKILPSIDEVNVIEITKKICESCNQTIIVESNKQNIISITKETKREDEKKYYYLNDYSFYNGGMLVLKNSNEIKSDLNKESTEYHKYNLVIDELGNYVTKIENGVISKDNEIDKKNYYKGNIKEFILNKDKTVYIADINKCSKKTDEKEYLKILENVTNSIEIKNINNKVKIK